LARCDTNIEPDGKSKEAALDGGDARSSRTQMLPKKGDLKLRGMVRREYKENMVDDTFRQALLISLADPEGLRATTKEKPSMCTRDSPGFA
jgi:hypothetical protein